MSTPTQLAGVFGMAIMTILNLLSTFVCGVVGCFWWPGFIFAAVCLFFSFVYGARLYYEAKS